ncbi:MAG: hypothetical protein LBB55_06865, partial [Zoogloeaceae bacterium]|nr:hypothetical protein [Zoogloeaceae bacterium]
MRNIVLATVYMLAFLGILWGFFTEDSRFAWLAALATLSIVGIIFHRWFSPRGRPRKTVRERTQDGRTLLFDKNEELKRVGFFDRIQGEFAVFFFVTALYMEDALAGHMSVLLFAVMTGVIWFINRPPHPLRHAPDRIYGTKDALLVAQ